MQQKLAVHANLFGPYLPRERITLGSEITADLWMCRCIICKNRVYILSVPTPGQPLNCGTTLAADNFFVKDLIIRLLACAAGCFVCCYCAKLRR